jgi:predicted amidophosphoribosyltransferase
MFCATCGQPLRDGARFCDHCGAHLEPPEAITYTPPAQSGLMNREFSDSRNDPYKEQIADLKLQIRQLKLVLKQINTGMSNKRSQHNETAAFVPRGMLRRGYKMIEDVQLWGPQQRKQQLQQELSQIEQELLGLQQAQVQWKRQHNGQ